MGQVVIAGGAVSGDLKEVVNVLTPAAVVVLDASVAGLSKLTPAQNTTVNATNVVEGSSQTLVVSTSGVTSYNVTFGTNFVTTGVLATGTTTAKTFLIRFIGLGTNLVEVSRTTAQ